MEDKKPKNYWTKERCREESLKYKNRSSFDRGARRAYEVSRFSGWLEEFFPNTKKTNPPNYWTKERCQEEALKYKNVGDFKKFSSAAYDASYKKSWIKEITGHFEVSGNRLKRFIYAYEFPDNHVYVGLTCNIERRKSEHLKQGAVFEHSESTRLIPEFKQLTINPIDVKEASKLEGDILNDYLSKGWIKINKTETGGTGGNIITWTYDACAEEALQYRYRTDFSINSKSAYMSAWKNEWLNEICSHMDEIIKPHKYWNFEKCKEEALKYERWNDFRKNCSSAYNSARAQGWLDDICQHMKPKYSKR